MLACVCSLGYLSLVLSVVLVQHSEFYFGFSFKDYNFNLVLVETPQKRWLTKLRVLLVALLRFS